MPQTELNGPSREPRSEFSHFEQRLAEFENQLANVASRSYVSQKQEETLQMLTEVQKAQAEMGHAQALLTTSTNQLQDVVREQSVQIEKLASTTNDLITQHSRLLDQQENINKVTEECLRQSANHEAELAKERKKRIEDEEAARAAEVEALKAQIQAKEEQIKASSLWNQIQTFSARAGVIGAIIAFLITLYGYLTQFIQHAAK